MLSLEFSCALLHSLHVGCFCHICDITFVVSISTLADVVMFDAAVMNLHKYICSWTQHGMGFGVAESHATKHFAAFAAAMRE